MDQIISDTIAGIKKKSAVKNHNLCAFSAFISLAEPKNIKEALKDADTINAM